MSHGRNVEIKARVPDLEPIRAKALGLTSAPPQHLAQTDTFFAVPRGRLKLREFGDGSGELIAYERADRAGPRQSTYIRCACEDAGTLARMLGRVLRIRGVVAKHREVYLVGHTRLHLDRVEKLGSFVELEVVLGDRERVRDGERVAQDLIRALGIPRGALIAEAYIDLLKRRGSRQSARPRPRRR